MLKPADLTALIRSNYSIPRKVLTVKVGDRTEQVDQGPLNDPFQLVVKEVLCSDDSFAAGELTDGRYVAWWPGHSDVVSERVDLVQLMNKHELAVYTFGINKGVVK